MHCNMREKKVCRAMFTFRGSNSHILVLEENHISDKFLDMVSWTHNKKVELQRVKKKKICGQHTKHSIALFAGTLSSLTQTKILF